MTKMYPSGENCANGTVDESLMKSWEKVEQKIGRVVASAGLTAGGLKVTELGFRLNESMVNLGNHAADVTDKVLGGAGAITGLGISGVGVAMTGAGVYLGYRLAKDHRLKEKFVKAYKNSSTKIKTKVTPFVAKAKKTIEEYREGVDITDAKGRYTATYVGNGKYVEQPLKKLNSNIKQMWQKLKGNVR